ncbi:TIM barrel protein [Anaerolineae bacterium CFX7]|nr:TIM barrel protein [Anaerolineae bacterium CFX7]
MSEIIVGCALSDVNRADLPRNLRVPERLNDYIELYQARLASSAVLLEIQPEDLWTVPATFPDQFIPRKNNRWWRTVQAQPELLAKLRAPNMRLGVHQPILNRDALSSNFFHKYEAIEATKQAMEFAEYIDADYFVFHLAQVDKWNWDRHDQMEKAVKIFNVFATYYAAREMSFTPLIETLVYPKFPATGAEAFLLLKECRKTLRHTRLALNIAHLWSSRNRMLQTQVWPDERVSFEASLEYALDTLADDVHLFDLSGGWESETHAIPGLHPQQDPFRYPMKLRESASVYAESGELDLNRVLELMVTATVRRDKDLRVVLQVFDRDIEQILEAARLIRHDLIARASAPAMEYRPIEIVTAKKKRAPARRRTAARRVSAARAVKNGHSGAKKKTRKKKTKKS